MRWRKKAGEGSGAMPDPTGLRAHLYGDVDMADWPPGEADGGTEPWLSFVRARDAAQRGATGEAEALWAGIADRSDVESRQVLQAWHFLRSMGVVPPGDVGKQVLGAVAEVAVGKGHDVLAVYADGSVHYLNVGGGATVVDTPVESVAAPARGLLGIAGVLAEVLEPWEGPLPELPAGHTRIVMLTPSGPHFGQGPDDALHADEAAGTFLAAATATLTAVVELTVADRR